MIIRKHLPMKTLICHKNKWVSVLPDKIGAGRIILGKDKREYKTHSLRYTDSLGYVWDAVPYIKTKDNAPNR